MEENKEFELQSSMPAAGSKIEEVNGNKISDADFSLVQQDKTIHDTKFTTKPTTFFKDALRRFAKNKSSVVGAIILGILFVLAVALPINGVIPYDIKNKHNYETNLPPKIHEAGNGFWDGTRWYGNSPYPYDGDGNYIGQGDEKALIEIKNITTGYNQGSTADGVGGFVQLNVLPSETEQRTYIYSYQYEYDFNHNYTVAFTLGTHKDSQSAPKYSLMFKTNDEFIDLMTTTDYKDAVEENLAQDQQIVTHTKQELNLTELVKSNPTLSAKLALSGNKLRGQVGLCAFSSKEATSNFYLKDFVFTSDSTTKTERRELAARSFDDANAMLLRPREVDGRDNNGYWASNNSTQIIPVDVKVSRCDILYDQYELTYGYRSDIHVFGNTFKSWYEAGYLTSGDFSTYTKGNIEENGYLTELGKQSGEVYVRSIENITTSTLSDGGVSYTFTCTVLMWKYLGYEKMPMHLMGTEQNGKDLLKYVFSGLRTSLLLGIIVSAINIIIGVVWGSISGYFGGRVDLTMERITDVLSGIPWIVLMTVLTLKLGSNFFVFALALCLTGWIRTASVTRSQFYRYRGREYVLAARTLGAKSPRLIFRHILPNAIGTIVTSSVLMIPSVIFSEATISYLGLGLQGLDSLGVILSSSQDFLDIYPYQMIFPAVIISLIMICFNLFGNGLRDAFNPSLKGTE